MDRRVAKRYARALFNTALKLDVVQPVEDDLNAIVRLMQSDEKLRDFILSPKVGREEKVQIAYKLFSDRVTAVTMQALRLLLDKRRETEIEGVLDEYQALRRMHGSVVYAVVMSAEELSEAEKKALIAKLKSQTGKEVEAEYRVDGALIGGVKVAYDNYVLDGSVRGTLNRLKDSWMRDVLKQG
jgi:F-type H+-transporting ATPase subunit delta